MYVSKQEMGVDRGQYIPDPKFSGRPGALSQFYAPKIDGSGGLYPISSPDLGFLSMALVPINYHMCKYEIVCRLLAHH